jgi:hypothetical protein
MRLERYRVRRLMVPVGAVALLVPGAIMGSRSYYYYRQAMAFSESERRWREIAARDRGWAKWGSQSADYYAQLVMNDRRAMWRPWMSVASDPPVPGFHRSQGK